jgi:serine protease Do
MAVRLRLVARRFGAAIVALALAVPLGLALPAAAPAQVPDLATGKIPTLAPLVREVTPAVVNISVQGKVREDNPLYRDPLFREFFDVPRQVEREVSAAGSGVIVDAARGYVLTANHVVAQVSRAQVTLKDGRRFAARLIGRDAATDIAVLQLQEASGLKALPIGDSDRLEVGDFVIAVGNPFGLGQTVTSGLVSALGRTGIGKQGFEDFIQTDAAINPGNSGGALINLRGELVGINTAIISPGGGNVGIGFAVPVNMARRVMEQLIATGTVRRGRIGVSVREAPREGGGAPGAVIAEVVPGSPAERAGLRRGDVVLRANGVAVRSATQFRNTIGLTPVGETVRLTVRRDGGATTDLAVTIAAPDQRASAD